MYSEGKKIKNDAYELIKQVEEENGIELSPIQKILTSLGPIGEPLSALFGTLQLFVLNQHIKNADENEAELLEIDEGDEIVYREVIVFKKGRPLFYALSYISKSRINDKVLASLMDEKITINNIIAENNIETLRDIKKLSVEDPTPIIRDLFKTDEKMLVRDHTISQHGTIRLWTRESYPLSYFNKN